MKIRRITSLTASVAFLLMLLTSIILYIVPQGRVAYWADWRLWGLTKTDWGNIHINLGLLFLIALFLVVRELKKHGIAASEELILKKIAAQNKTSPTDVYERIKNIVQN